MTMQELADNLRALSPGDQMAAIQILAQAIETKTQGIAKTPGVMGGEACIRGTRIPVWLLVSYRHQGMTEGEILKGYPDLSAADLLCAWAYAKAYGEEITAAIRGQEERDELPEITRDEQADIGDRVGNRAGDRVGDPLRRCVAEAYRMQAIGAGEVRRMLGLKSRLEVHNFLKEMGIHLNYDEAELRKDLEMLSERQAG